MESALLQQVKNAGPPAPVATPSPLALVVVGNPLYNTIAQSATFNISQNSTLRCALLGWHPDCHFKWLRHNHLSRLFDSPPLTSPASPPFPVLSPPLRNQSTHHPLFGH